MSTATNVNQLADEMFGILCEEQPVTATLFGIPGYDDRLPDLDNQAERARLDKAEDVAARARALEGLDGQDAITRAIVLQQAQALADRTGARLVEHTLSSPLAAPVASLFVNLPLVRPSGEAAECDYLTRLAAIPGYLAGALTRHRAGVEAGRLPLAHLAKAAIAHLDRYLADPHGDPLREPVLTGSRADERERLLAEVVRPAFTRYRNAIEGEIAPHGRPEEKPGLCWLPDGEATYAALVRMHTTTERTPEELHQTGLDLIAKLAEEYVEIGSRVFGVDSVSEVHHRLRTDPALRWGSAEELLSTARATVERAERAASGWFGQLLPAQSCRVEPVPANEAPGGPSAYYIRPALDGSRPGTYYANTYQVEERDRFTAEALAFHEAVPGHHFQLTIAQQLTGLPLLRRLARVNAYTEGWALYTERLADEMGLYSDDIARLGMLAEDSTRAARLVVDTGLHALGWSRQRVVDYLREHTVMSEVDLQSETDRYIEIPGQALSYMVGRLELQRLRGGAERELGADFDIRAFHDLVLGNGILPMSVLAEVVDGWVASLR